MDGVFPNNRVIAQRIAQQAVARGNLGDYPAALPHRVLATKGSAGQEGGAIDGGLGPVTAPVIRGEREMTALDYLREIRDLLRRLPQSMSLEFRTKFPMVPREAISFVATSGSVALPAGTAVAVVSQTVNERFSGFVTRVGVNVVPAGSFGSVLWQIRVNGNIHPSFFNRVFSTSTLNDPDDFIFEIIQSRTVELVAINTGAVPLTVQGKLVGWTEFLTDNKSYGGQPASGVA